MTSSSVFVYLSVACVAVTGLQDSQSFQSLLPTLSRVEDQAFSERIQQLRIPSLEEDLEEFNEYSSLSRIRRNAAEKHRIYPKCCGSGDKPDFTEETMKIYKNCTEQLDGSGLQEGTKACLIAVCIGREKALLDEDGYVKEEEFVKLIDEAYTDDSLKDAAKRAGPECVKKANERAKEVMNEELLEKSCNLAGIMAYQCAKYEVILNCPEDQTVNTEECNNFRQMMHEWMSKKQQTPDN